MEEEDKDDDEEEDRCKTKRLLINYPSTTLATLPADQLHCMPLIIKPLRRAGEKWQWLINITGHITHIVLDMKS